MTEVTIGPLLRALRERTGRSQAQQAELLSQLAGRPVTRNEISRWENETRLLTPYWQEHTAASFEMQTTELTHAVSAARAQRRRARSGDRPPPEYDAPSVEMSDGKAVCLSVPAEAVGHSLPTTSLNCQCPCLGNVHVREPVPRVVCALEVTRQTAVSDSAAIEDLNTVIEHYKQTFRSTPPSELYNDILGVRAHAGTLLDGTRTANNSPDLVVMAGWLSNLLALVTHDLDDRAASLVWCADAERRGREAHYPELEGWASHTRVLMSFYDGQAREAVTHAQRGQKLAPLGTVAHAKLVAQEMRAWALLGNSDKVSSTRWRAEEAIAKLPPSTPTRGTFSISLADDPPYTATSLLLLGRHKEAVEAARRVLATFYGSCAGEGRGEHPSGFARTYLILALALAGLGKLDEAYAAGSIALEAPRLVWPVAVLAGKLDRILMLDFAGAAEACDYHERYVAAMQQNPSAGGRLARPDTFSS